MIIDYIPQEKLPYLIVWLDWNFYAYRTSFLVCLILMSLHYTYKITVYNGSLSIGGYVTACFVGFCLWCFYIASNQGYGVG